MVFGGLDGLVTTFAVISSLAGANIGGNSSGTVIALGLANLVADGISMGLGDFISEKAELEYVVAERQREAWEMDNYPEGEIKEMVEIYTARGMPEEDANLLMSTMAKHKKIFVDHMMVEELGLMPPGDGGLQDAALKGAVTFFSFLGYGCVPLVVYGALYSTTWTGTNHTFLIAAIFTAFTCFMLGVAAAVFTNPEKPGWRRKFFYLKSGFFMLCNGFTAAGAAYGIGYAAERALGNSAAVACVVTTNATNASRLLL
jgi:VIT1/CCC1 family predicted Fe2+/Mn2+ transporter